MSGYRRADVGGEMSGYRPGMAQEKSGHPTVNMHVLYTAEVRGSVLKIFAYI